MKQLVSIIAGYALWTVIWLAGGFLVKAVMPDSFNDAGFTDNTGILVGFLVLSVVASLLSGRCTASLTAVGKQTCVRILAALLLLTGLGVQIGVWDSMPVWYHVPFLLLLYPATIWGGR